MDEIEVIIRGSQGNIVLPDYARDRRLIGHYRTLYNHLLTQALNEFPPIEGYITTHTMLVERAVYFFCKQKEDEDSPIQDFDIKRYKMQFSSFIKSCEGLLKEARSISAETTYKHNFVRQVVEVLDRMVEDKRLKMLIRQELLKVAGL